ncbi:MAG: hypothetical protein HQL51_16475 [Magnetococcales bacterium]|nr:hypothetical protein [Magnetococcales bacterium]
MFDSDFWARLKKPATNLIVALIGCAGFLSAVVTMFIDTTQQVSVKLLLFVILLLMISWLLLWKKDSDATVEADPNAKVKPFRCLTEKGILLIKPNPSFVHDMFVEVHREIDKIEQYVGVGRVILVQQSGVVQIEVMGKESEIRDHKDLFVVPCVHCKKVLG